MGVKGLLEYIDNVLPNSIEQIDLNEEINNFKALVYKMFVFHLIRVYKNMLFLSSLASMENHRRC